MRKSEDISICLPLRSCRTAFTLVELLVVIAIIGILVALALPAISMARESARRASCSNNLKQLALAIKLHEGAHGTYPTGGWGADWVGDPDRGYGPKQPGGWIYNILPYIEEGNLRDIGSGLPLEEKGVAMTKLLATPLEPLVCSSRRLARPYPYTGSQALRNAIAPEKAGKTDYAINVRISYEKSEMIVSEIQLSDGLSKTILLGEKAMSKESYSKGTSSGDQLSMYQGDCSDIRRTASGFPVNDRSGGGSGFGAAHPAGCNIAYCDGSVKFINLDEEF